MAAYRKLLVHNEVVSGSGANCLNDITKVLYVPSKHNDTSKIINQDELDFLSKFDFENQIDYDDAHLMDNDENFLKQHSTAYLASVVENRVLSKMLNKGEKGCSMCINLFFENEVTDDSFIEYKSVISNILPPCKSTIELMNTVDNLLKAYGSESVSFDSMLTHIIQKINKDIFYKQSSCAQHDHRYQFIELVVKTYMDIRSIETCKTITKLSQAKLTRHFNLKETHRAGQ